MSNTNRFNSTMVTFTGAGGELYCPTSANKATGFIDVTTGQVFDMSNGQESSLVVNFDPKCCSNTMTDPSGRTAYLRRCDLNMN